MDGMTSDLDELDRHLSTGRRLTHEQARSVIDELRATRADRAALRECVRQMLESVEPLVAMTSAATQIKFAEVLNAARAKVGKPDA